MANGILKVGEITTSTGSGNITIGSGVTLLSNTPAVEAYLSSTQTISDATVTKVSFDSEILDTDSCFDSSTNYRFTPNRSGKYFISANLRGGGGGTTLDIIQVYIRKNGSDITNTFSQSRFNGNYIQNVMCEKTSIVELNGTTDYVEIYAYVDLTSGSPEVNSDGSSLIIYRIGA